jgi:hypothetical protein
MAHGVDPLVEIGGQQVPNKGVKITGKKRLKNDRYHDDHDKKRNPMRYVSNKGEGRPQLFFFNSCRVIL